MMSEDRAARAHDALVKLLEDPRPIEQTALHYVSVALDVLCWVLEHPHNPNFSANLDRIERALGEAPAAEVPIAKGTVQ